jgi:hypothetical protein
MLSWAFERLVGEGSWVVWAGSFAEGSRAPEPLCGGVLAACEAVANVLVARDGVESDPAASLLAKARGGDGAEAVGWCIASALVAVPIVLQTMSGWLWL